jgi:hypothetical protein
MSELMDIIEKLRQKGYFVSDFQYEFVDDERISLDGGVWPNPDKVHGHRSLVRMLEDHVENGIHTNLVQIRIDFVSRKMKLPEQEGNLDDNGRFDYPVRVEIPEKRMRPYLKYNKFQNPEKIYEDVTKVFQDFGWIVEICKD